MKEINLRKAGKRNTAIAVKQLSICSPKRGSIVKKTLETHTSDFLPISADDALAVITDAQISTHQYDIIRQKININVPNLLPSYHKIKEAKAKCYPDSRTVSESSAECGLQSLVNHSIERSCLAQKDVLDSVSDFKIGLKELFLLIKWGCDGAQQKQYKQKFSSGHHFDENLFGISMVSIQLYFLQEENKKVVWQNPAPSSTRYCRPIKFNFAKETTELIKLEVDSIQEQIKMLQPVEINNDSFNIQIKPIFLLTMIDGKICTALSPITSSSQTCYICAAKPSEMNNSTKLSEKQVDQQAMSYGLSPLHSWIRFMECILHIAYRLDVKVWQVRDQESKEKVKARKKLIQDRFRAETGLLVDMPTQQSGNMNDGNTAKRFFRDEEKTAEITGIDKEIIKKFHIILEAIGSGFPIDIDAFETFARETRELYIRKYGWFCMPVSVHKVLFHGKQIISTCILPIGQLSEEAQEAGNKENRKFRELFTRKTSRVDTNTDFLNRLLVFSDPFLVSLRCIPKTKKNIN